MPFLRLTALALLLWPGIAAAAEGEALTMRVLSSGPAYVTGGDALIEVTGADDARVSVNGKDQTKSFFAASAGRRLGLVTGLRDGANTITAASGTRAMTLELKSHPITGPVFSGPKEQPFVCETTKFKLKDGGFLPPARDADCSVETSVRYVYKAQGAAEFKPLTSMTALPADVAQTKTTTGQMVPYVVRVEAGTINRGVYQLAMLHDPTTGGPPTPAQPPQAWNGKMIYTFGGGCGGMYRQGTTTGEVLEDPFVGQGYVVMSNSLNVFSVNCDDLLASETVMMTRERAIERVGPPAFVIGWGCSGGAHQVLQTADNYPGLLDGIVPLCNSVDFYRLGQHTADLTLLYAWFKTESGKGLTDIQKLAITGTPLKASGRAYVFFDAGNCPDVIADDKAFDPAKNPSGLRCSQGDHQVNVLGRDARTGKVGTTLDNVGLQYGLSALNTGKISVREFLTLNEQVGGYDTDGKFSSARAVADPKTLEAVYRTGRILSGAGGLRDVPILEIRNYSDRDVNATHLKYGTNVLVARLERGAGSRANHVFLLESQSQGAYSASRNGGDALSRYGLEKMDAWLMALSKDKGPASRQEKVVRAKPADLVDACFDADGARIDEPFGTVGGRCSALYPDSLPPRSLAGGPLANDVLKCALKPIDRTDYQVRLSDDEYARLARIFPAGVCDWSNPGVGQVPLAGTWQAF